MLGEEVNVFSEYGVLNYWTHLVGAIFYRSGTGAEYAFVLKNKRGTRG